jgi:hypothetical protein
VRRRYAVHEAPGGAVGEVGRHAHEHLACFPSEQLISLPVSLCLSTYNIIMSTPHWYWFIRSIRMLCSRCSSQTKQWHTAPSRKDCSFRNFLNTPVVATSDHTTPNYSA